MRGMNEYDEKNWSENIAHTIYLIEVHPNMKPKIAQWRGDCDPMIR